MRSVSRRIEAGALPPTAPDDWRTLDRVIVAHLLPHQRSGVSYLGDVPCLCGGKWRYLLGGAPNAPIWRCLHCGCPFCAGTPVHWD